MVFHSFDEDYIRRLKSGDAETERHFSSYFNELLSIKLRARLRSRQLIEDVRQETLLRVLQTVRIKAGIEHPERFGAFVNAVCNNVLLEYCRAESRHPQMPENAEEPPDASVDLNEPLVTSDRKRLISNALAELPEKDRDILRSIYLYEEDKQSVCERYHVDGDYLRVLIHRAKSRFRKAYLQKV